MNTNTQFTQKMQEAILYSFPESKVDVYVRKGLGGDAYCHIIFTLAKDLNECSNRIAENDHVLHKIMITGFDVEGNPKDKLCVESNYGSFYIKPQEKYLAYSRIKTGWRNFTTTEAKAIEKVGTYFAKVKDLLNENFDVLTDNTQQLMIKKSYKK